MFRLIVISSALLLTLSSRPTFVSELWPEEGRPVFVATGTELVLRSQPSTESSIVARPKVRRGAPISFDKTEYQTFLPGRCVALGHGMLRVTTTASGPASLRLSTTPAILQEP